MPKNRQPPALPTETLAHKHETIGGWWSREGGQQQRKSAKKPPPATATVSFTPPAQFITKLSDCRLPPPTPKATTSAVRKFYRRQAKLLAHYTSDEKHVREQQIAFADARSEGDLDGSKSTSESAENGSGKGLFHCFPWPWLNKHIADAQQQKQQTTTMEAKKLTTAASVRRLVWLTLLVNISLTVVKAIASYLSGSLAIFSSLIDSGVDISSGLVINLAQHAIRKHDRHKYPVGRASLENVALVIISVIMFFASVQMIVQSLNAIIEHDINPRVDGTTISIMLSTVAVKVCLFFFCSKFGTDATARMLAQDHRNDCVSNSVALICAFSAHKYWLFLDPIGAILVSLYICITWYETGREHILKLSGLSAEPAFISRIVKVCINFDQRVCGLDSVLAYHFGNQFFVEVHLLLDDADVRREEETHDVGEALQSVCADNKLQNFFKTSFAPARSGACD